MYSKVPELIVIICSISLAFLDFQNGENVINNIGAILDTASREGKEARVAMELALLHLNTASGNNDQQSFRLRVRDSRGSPLHAADAARDLISKQRAEAIIGLHTWEEASLVGEAISMTSHIPFVSLSSSTPHWATETWPFFVQPFPSQSAQMKAMAAIVQSWEWHQITFIYEDGVLGADEVFPHLNEAFQESGIRINIVLLPPIASGSLPGELQKLAGQQCRVFVVHASLSTTVRLFRHAKRMKMMEKEYVWITTDVATNLFHSLNASTISLMQGVVGIMSYFPETGQDFQDFRDGFRRKFGAEYPREEGYEPGIFAVQAYDATWLLAQAFNEAGANDGSLLLEKISSLEFDGLSGTRVARGLKASPASVFRIVNVAERSLRELGFWSDGVGFSEFIDERAVFNSSMAALGPVLWPGKPWHVPRGWSPIATGNTKLKVGVPSMSSFGFVNVKTDTNSNNFSVSGLSIDIFKETLPLLPYHLQYEFHPFNGSYDDLVKQVYLKEFDAVAGDVAIFSRRCEYVEFTHPYTDSGLVMVVPVQPELRDKPWLFMKPFTESMWAIILTVTIYNGFVVWLIERDHFPELAGSSVNQIGILVWLSFTSLLSLHGGRLHSNLSRISMVVWLFVALIITQSYTASLASMLTVQRLVPTVPDIEALRHTNGAIGHCRGSYVPSYLKQVLGLKFNRMIEFDSPADYAGALRSGEIAAAFFDVSDAKVFLAKYCNGFTISGPTYKVGGFGFVFPKGSPLLADVNEALLKLSEVGKLRELEKNVLGSIECVDLELKKGTSYSMDTSSFLVLFIFTVGTSTICLMIYGITNKSKFKKAVHEPSLDQPRK